MPKHSVSVIKTIERYKHVLFFYNIEYYLKLHELIQHLLRIYVSEMHYTRYQEYVSENNANWNAKEGVPERGGP